MILQQNCFFFFFYLLHVAAISFLPKPTAQFSGAVQPSDSYQTAYMEQCDLLNCSRRSKFGQIFHACWYLFTLASLNLICFPELLEPTHELLLWPIFAKPCSLIFRRTALSMISSQTFDNHKLTQGVRSHSIPPVRAAEGGAARRAAEGEGSGSRHLPDRQPFESMVCSGPEQSQHVSEAMHHKVLSTLKTNFLIFFFLRSWMDLWYFCMWDWRGWEELPALTQYRTQQRATSKLSRRRVCLHQQASWAFCCQASYICSAQLDVY